MLVAEPKLKKKCSVLNVNTHFADNAILIIFVIILKKEKDHSLIKNAWNQVEI